MDLFLTAVGKIFTSQGSQLDPGLVIPRTAIVFIVAIIYVRMAKKRFIAQASAMDLVMAVVFGSLLSRAINGGATLASGLSAGFTLVVLQRVFAHYSCASPAFSKLVNGDHETLVKDGVMDRDEMKKHDISEEDLRADIRLNGMTDKLEEVRLAVLERSGQISVVKKN